MQKLLIKYLLNPVAKAAEKIPQTVRPWIISVSVMAMILLEFAYDLGIFTRYIYVFVLFCFFLGLIILSGLTTTMRPIAVSPLLWGCWLLFGTIVFGSGIFLNVDYLSNGILWLVVFPVLFIVWGNQSFKGLIKPIINGVYLAFVVFVLISILKHPVLNIRYTSLFHNPNTLSMYMMATFVAALTDFLEQKKFSVRVLIIALVIGMTAAITFYTSSRAGQYIMIFSAACTLVIYLLIQKGHLAQKLLYVVLPTVLLVAFLIPNGIYILNAKYEINKFITSMHPGISTPTMPSATEPSVTEPSATEPSVTEPSATEPSVTEPSVTEPPATETKPNNQTILDNITDFNEDRYNQGTNTSDTLDYYTSGRVELWKAFLKKVKLFGNPPGQILYREDGRRIYASSHCTIIQVAYEYGALAAVLLLAFNLAAGVKAFAFMHKNRGEAYSAFPIIIAITYGVYYLLETIILPPVYLLALLYFISQIPLMKKHNLRLRK